MLLLFFEGGSPVAETVSTALRAGGAKRGKKRYIWIGEDIAKLIDGEEPEIMEPDVPDAEPEVQEAPRFEEIRQVAREHKQEARVMKMFRQQDYSQMLALYARLLEQQEEDDIETLLMLL